MNTYLTEKKNNNTKNNNNDKRFYLKYTDYF